MMTDECIKREDARDLLEIALDDDWEIDYANDRFDEIPAADVRPVVRGKWILDERMVLAMLAGARAIEQNPRKYLGTIFVYEPFGINTKEITYCEAAKKLRETAEAALKGET